MSSGSRFKARSRKSLQECISRDQFIAYCSWLERRTDHGFVGEPCPLQKRQRGDRNLLHADEYNKLLRAYQRPEERVETTSKFLDGPLPEFPLAEPGERKNALLFVCRSLTESALFETRFGAGELRWARSFLKSHRDLIPESAEIVRSEKLPEIERELEDLASVADYVVDKHGRD